MQNTPFAASYITPGSSDILLKTENYISDDEECDINDEEQKEMQATLHRSPFEQSIKVPMPYSMHPTPSLVKDSNKFRQNGPNRIMYPSKNGPVANIIKCGGDPNIDLPNIDPFDELTHDIQLKIDIQFASELHILFTKKFNNHLQNVRSFTRNKDMNEVIQELKAVSKIKV